jgi:hypothetical protein
MGRGKPQHYRDRQQHGWSQWLQRVFRDNRPWNVAVAEMLLARPGSAEDRGLIWFVYEREDDHQKLAEAIAPAFFGVRIECAQCHDHMSAGEIEQRHYWGLVAFFSRSSNVKKKSGRYVAESAIGHYAEFADLSGSSAPNLLSFLDVPTVSEERPAAGAEETDADNLYISGPTPESPRIPRNSRRQKFVEQVVAGHPRVARAFVNRIWALLLGRGIVHPFDQMDSMHEPSHPELLDELAEDFEESGFDIRRLVRGISLSRPYALSSVRPTGSEDPATFAWYLQRPLTAEQMGRSIHLAVRGQLNHAPSLITDLRETIPAVLPNESVTTMQEALFLTNNSALNDFIRDSTGGSSLIADVFQLDEPDEQVEKLFLTIFGREPSAAEVSEIRNYLSVPASTSEQTPSDAGGISRRAARLQQVIWSMLTSAEFRFNH